MQDIIVLFGAGKNGKRILDQHKFEESEMMFCDNDEKKQDTIYCGTRILSFDKMMELYAANTGRIKIVLTMADEREILYQCLSAGIKVNDLYCWDEKSESLRFIGEKHVETVCSQDGEEIFLRELFRGQDKGTYIDIGANHPFRFSNTYWAYARGWRGINIEPDVINYELLKNIRKEDINLNCGVSNEETQLTYYMFKESALNTFCLEEIRDRDQVKDTCKAFRFYFA